MLRSACNHCLLAVLFLALTLPLSGQSTGRKTYKSIVVLGSVGQSISEKVEYGWGGELSYGFNVSNAFKAGIGAGLNIFGSHEYKRVIPVFTEVQWTPFTQFRNAPYVQLDGGYAWGWQDENSFYRDIEGGMRLHGGIGVRWRVFPKSSLTTELGLLRQTVTATRDNWWWWGNRESDYIRETYQLNRWVLRVGWAF